MRIPRLLLLTVLAALAAALAASLVPSASANHVEPVLVGGNSSCGKLLPGTTELKIDPAANGTFSDGTLTVTTVVRDTATGPVLDLTSNIGVDAVFVKGGRGGNLYRYNQEVSAHTGLHAPVNPKNGKFFGLGHLSVCYDVETVTTAVVHYFRPAGDYADWGLHLWGNAIADGVGTDWLEPLQRTGVDLYGAVYEIPLKDATQPVSFIVHRPGGDTVPLTCEPGGDRSFIPATHPEIWLVQGDPTIYYSPPTP